jgi:C_GCAxxG_C_C family probable redox protein
VLLSVTESQGIRSDLIPRIATGFCGGIARTSNICGAVSGAIMAVNISYGRLDPTSSPEKNYTKVREMIALFEGQFGTTNCRELIGCDLATQEGQQQFKANHTIERCKQFSLEAARTALRIITEFNG